MGMAAVEEMAHKQGVDWVMVELTGLADPGPIAKGFWENEEMGDLVLDGVVCVVDCRNVLRVSVDFGGKGAGWGMGQGARGQVEHRTGSDWRAARKLKDQVGEG